MYDLTVLLHQAWPTLPCEIHLESTCSDASWVAFSICAFCSPGAINPAEMNWLWRCQSIVHSLEQADTAHK